MRSTKNGLADSERGGRMRHSPPSRGVGGGMPGRYMSGGDNAGRQPHVQDGEEEM
jgi:hypothetical protein